MDMMMGIQDTIPIQDIPFLKHIGMDFLTDKKMKKKIMNGIIENRKQKICEWIDNNWHLFVNNQGEIDDYILEFLAKEFNENVEDEEFQKIIVQHLLDHSKLMIKFKTQGSAITGISVIPKSTVYKQ